MEALHAFLSLLFVSNETKGKLRCQQSTEISKELKVKYPFLKAFHNDDLFLCNSNNGKSRIIIELEK